MSDINEVAARHVGDLIQEVEPGAFAGRFVVLAEVTGSDGERALWSLTPPDATAWDSLGLLSYATQLEQAGITWDQAP